MPATVPSFQDHFISVARPGPRHQVESLERNRLAAALAPPVLLRSLVQPLQRGVDLGKLRGLARGVHDIPLLVCGVRPPISRLLLNRVAGCAIVARERIHDPCTLLEQASLQMLPLCRRQRHTPSPWEIAALRASRKHCDATTSSHDAPRPSSTASHARAARSSRLTVASETPRASAVSSSDSPLK